MSERWEKRKRWGLVSSRAKVARGGSHPFSISCNTNIMPRLATPYRREIKKRIPSPPSVKLGWNHLGRWNRPSVLTSRERREACGGELKKPSPIEWSVPLPSSSPAALFAPSPQHSSRTLCSQRNLFVCRARLWAGCLAHTQIEELWQPTG